MHRSNIHKYKSSELCVCTILYICTLRQSECFLVIPLASSALLPARKTRSSESDDTRERRESATQHQIIYATRRTEDEVHPDSILEPRIPTSGYRFPRRPRRPADLVISPAWPGCSRSPAVHSRMAVGLNRYCLQSRGNTPGYP